jgi:hypothetical protein
MWYKTTGIQLVMDKNDRIIIIGNQYVLSICLVIVGDSNFVAFSTSSNSTIDVATPRRKVPLNRRCTPQTLSVATAL